MSHKFHLPYPESNRPHDQTKHREPVSRTKYQPQRYESTTKKGRSKNEREPYLATGVCGGEDERTMAIAGSAAAPDELLTSSRISFALLFTGEWRLTLCRRNGENFLATTTRRAPNWRRHVEPASTVSPASRRQFFAPGIWPKRPAWIIWARKDPIGSLKKRPNKSPWTLRLRVVDVSSSVTSPSRFSGRIPRRVQLRRAEEGLRGELARGGRDDGRGEHLGVWRCYRAWGTRLPVVEIRM